MAASRGQRRTAAAAPPPPGAAAQTLLLLLLLLLLLPCVFSSPCWQSRGRIQCRQHTVEREPRSGGARRRRARRRAGAAAPTRAARNDICSYLTRRLNLGGTSAKPAARRSKQRVATGEWAAPSGDLSVSSLLMDETTACKPGCNAEEALLAASPARSALALQHGPCRPPATALDRGSLSRAPNPTLARQDSAGLQVSRARQARSVAPLHPRCHGDEEAGELHAVDRRGLAPGVGAARGGGIHRAGSRRAGILAR